MTEIAIKDLENLCHDVLRKAGLDEQDIIDGTEHFIENELSGKASHGMVRVIQAVGLFKKYGLPTAPLEWEVDNGNMAVINAHGHLGAHAAKIAMLEAIKRGKEHGLALIGVRNYMASTGTMTFYLRRIAEAGLIAIIGCNSGAMVCAPAGRKACIGTNPIGLAVPGENGQHFIADLATSSIAYGKILVMKDKGEDVPEGLLIDKDGNPSINPSDAKEGAILPFGDYKGFALGLMIEILSAPLIGAKACKKDSWDNDGTFMIIIDPSKIAQNGFTSDVHKILQDIKNDAPRPGYDKVSLPGERSAELLKTALKNGKINVVDKTLEKLYALAK